MSAQSRTYRNTDIEGTLIRRDGDTPEDAAEQYQAAVEEAASMYNYDKTPPDESAADEFSLEPDADGVMLFCEHVFTEAAHLAAENDSSE